MRQPKKAVIIEQSMVQQPQQAVKLNKLVMNAKLELLNGGSPGLRSNSQHHQHQQQNHHHHNNNNHQHHHHHQQQHPVNGNVLNDSRVSIRKRSHNALMPLLEKHNAVDNGKYKANAMSPNRREHSEVHKITSIVKRKMPVAQVALTPDAAIKRMEHIAENHIR